ncbi:MAG TPA: histidine phosphatase family protein [Alphaproteobacteria bacterium]
MILMRHGQSEFNVVYGATRTDPGIRDPRLTALGHSQVADAAAGLRAAGVAIRRVVASPYTRALESARILAAALAVPVAVEPLVRERFAWTCDIGTPLSELAPRWPGVSFPDMAERWWPEREEHDHEVYGRATAFRRAMAGDPVHAETLVVSHWWFIRAFSGAELANGALVRVRLAETVEVVTDSHP